MHLIIDLAVAHWNFCELLLMLFKSYKQKKEISEKNGQ